MKKLPVSSILKLAAANAHDTTELEVVAQCRVFAYWVEHQMPGSFLFCYPAEACYKQKHKWQAVGVWKGLPDFFAIMDGQVTGIEMKREKPKGRVSRDQVECHKILKEAGVQVYVTFGYDETIKKLRELGLLPP